MDTKRYEKMAAEILAVWDYKSGEDSCNSVYMGGMAQAAAFRLLGGRRSSIKEALTNARPDQVADCHKYLEHYIDYMKAHPTHKCPTCGQTVPGKA